VFILEKMSSSSNDTEDEKKAKLPGRRKKGKNYYSEKWQESYTWLVKGRREGSGRCFVCSCEFSISNGGKADVKRHQTTEKHRKNFEAHSKTTSARSFFNAPPSSSFAADLKRQSAAAEGAFVFHTVKHSHSYRSADCGSGLFAVIFKDSKIAANFSCGKTKVAKIITNVLAKTSVELLLTDLKNRPFSIATDASNKGNIKMFPLVCRYFSKEAGGVQTKLLSFFNSQQETSKDISRCLLEKLNTNNLNPANIISFCGDNASVNFGCHQSVFTELRKQNNDMISMGCLCHVLHNAVKNASSLLKIDIEAIILRTYSEFSSHSKRLEELMEFYHFCDLEFSELLRHVPTRWLTLLPASEKLYVNFQPVKSYFLSKENCPAFLTAFFENELADTYLCMFSNICSTIQKIILVLEQDGPIIIKLFELISNLLRTLKSKLNDGFYGIVVQQNLKKCDNLTEVSLFKRRANAFVEYIINYIESRFNIQNNKYETLSIFQLRSELKFEDFTKVIEDFKIPGIDTDVFYEEYVNLKSFRENLTEIEFEDIEKIWIKFMNTFVVPNTEKIINFIFALPHSNAMSERIFSLMFYAWRKDRNRLALVTVEAEMLIKTNFKHSCKDFYNFILSNEKLLKEITSNEKYCI
jgi:hypothetical protein